MKKCCIACLIVFFVLALAFGIAFGVIWNSTPLKLGFANERINDGPSIADFGLEQTKVKDIVNGFVKLDRFKSETVLTNQYSPITESPKLTKALENSTAKDGSSLTCSKLLADKISYPDSYLITYDDTTLAFLFDTAISTAENNSKYGADAFSVVEITIAIKDNQPHARIILKQKAEMSFEIFNNVLCIIDFDFDVDEYGIPHAKNTLLSINDNNEVIKTMINKLYFDNYEGGIDGLASTLSSTFVKILNNLGVIGTASCDSNNIVTDNVNYGISGIENGKITVLTYTAK